MHLELLLVNTWETVLFLLAQRRPGIINSKQITQEHSKMQDWLLISNSSSNLVLRLATKHVRIINLNLKFKFRRWASKESEWNCRNGLLLIWPFLLTILNLAAAIANSQLLELNCSIITHCWSKLHRLGGLCSHLKWRRLFEAPWTTNNCYLYQLSAAR